MVCSLPSSKTRKSSLARLETKRFLSSVTVTGTITSFTWTRIFVRGGSCACGAAGGCCWQIAARDNIVRASPRRPTRENAGWFITVSYILAQITTLAGQQIGAGDNVLEESAPHTPTPVCSGQKTNGIIEACRSQLRVLPSW